MKTISSTTRRRLDIQGFENVDDRTLAEIAPWQRLPYALCALIAGIGTILASPVILWLLVPIAALGAVFPVHPFDLIYNHGVRYRKGTGPIPKRGAPVRFACGLGAVWVAATALAFSLGAATLGYVLGFALVGVAALVGTTDICIPSLVYRSLFGFPPKRERGSDSVSGENYPYCPVRF